MHQYTAALIYARFKHLKTGYLRKHGNPRRFEQLLDGMIREAHNMSEKPRKRMKQRSREEVEAARARRALLRETAGATGGQT
jgi:hypothetical protein